MLCNPLKAVYYNNFISNCKYLEKRHTKHFVCYYMPKKSAKYGIKTWAVSDAKSRCYFCFPVYIASEKNQWMCVLLEMRNEKITSAINTQLHSVHHVGNIENVEDRKSVKMSQIAKRFVKRENFNQIVLKCTLEQKCIFFSKCLYKLN